MKRYFLITAKATIISIACGLCFIPISLALNIDAFAFSVGAAAAAAGVAAALLLKQHQKEFGA